jgi:hypothetical protein
VPVLPLDLPPATASGIGSLPGAEPLEAVPLPLTLPGLPYLPELPARGPGADMIGRAFGVLAELYAELAPSGWRFAEHPGRETRRAVSFLGQDLDALEERAEGYAGAFKIQVAGPWTLASTVELRHGDKALSDPGACRDIAASLADGLRGHVAEVRKRLPGVTSVVVQLDEPALPGVLRGSVPTASGFGTLRAVEATVAAATLKTLVETLAGDGVPVVAHSCADGTPVALLHRAGVAGLALDLIRLGQTADEALGEFLEDGGILLAGVVPSLDQAGGLSPLAGSVAPVQELWHRLGLPRAGLASVVPVPTCGMAGASPAYVRAATTRCADTARQLTDLAEE